MKEEDRRDMIREWMHAHPGSAKSAVVSHFVGLGFKRRSVYSIISRLKGGGDVSRKPGSGKQATELTEGVRTAIAQEAAGKAGISLCSLGSQFGFHHQTIKKDLKSRNVIQRSRRTAPYANERQKAKQKVILRKLRDTHFRKKNGSVSVIMDDESYFDQNGMESVETSTTSLTTRYHTT